MADQPQQAEPGAAEGGGNVRSQRTALAVLGLIAAIAVGFGLGFLANQFLHDEQPATPVAGSVDVGFAQDMTVHHNQAVEMAAIAIANAEDPMVRDLAYDILTTQQNQIGQMTGWLSLWNQPLLPTGDYMTWMDPATTCPVTAPPRPAPPSSSPAWPPCPAWPAARTWPRCGRPAARPRTCCSSS